MDGTVLEKLENRRWSCALLVMAVLRLLPAKEMEGYCLQSFGKLLSRSKKTIASRETTMQRTLVNVNVKKDEKKQDECDENSWGILDCHRLHAVYKRNISIVDGARQTSTILLQMPTLNSGIYSTIYHSARNHVAHPQAPSRAPEN